MVARLLADPLLPERPRSFILAFSMSVALFEEIDPMAPQREAALFYGLFLRGHSADALRKDIDVPKPLFDKMIRRHRNELRVQARLQRAYHYRKQVLAIFDEQVTRERITRFRAERIP